MSVSERYSRSSVGSSLASIGSWLARMPIEPTAVNVEIISTSSENTSPSGVSTSTGNLLCAIVIQPVREQLYSSRSLARSQCQPASFLRRLDNLVDCALQEERALGYLVVLAFDDLLEAPDRLRDRHVGAGGAGELFGHEERL